MSTEHQKNFSNTHDQLDIFRQTGWASEIRPDKQEAILSLGKVRNFKARSAVYSAGERSDGLYGVLNGVVELTHPNELGEMVAFHQVEPGYWIGDLAHLAKKERLITISAVTDAALLHLDASAIDFLLKQHPTLITDFYRLTYQNVRLALRLISSLSASQNTRAIVMRLLIHDDGGAPSSWFVLSQKSLAEMTGISYPTVRRVMRPFLENGWVETAPGRMRITNRSALLASCEST
ncbi:Crp/Fnr family transcriptional regulator [Roseibium sp. SCP14]|uniref:Crp/Fnr family transcriptional regulator n=1 Tax=Roseibium sp. SCP14 TaxID=3141375 RepID=UPI003334BC81